MIFLIQKFLSSKIARFGSLIVAVTVSPAAEYQWSVPMPPSQERRAYLWIPPDCERVRGLIIGLQNMLEKPMFEDTAIRKAAAETGLGIVWISPGSEGKGTPLNQEFSPRDQAVQVMQQTLAALAKASGYHEVEFAPLLAVGHSAATPFVWGMGDWSPSRVFAIIPIKGWYPALAAKNIPIFHISQEWSEWGTNWGEAWINRERPAAMRLRAEGQDRLLGEFLDVGAGHFDWTPESAKVVGMFIRKAVQYRLPDDAPLDGQATLKPIDPKSGWLIDALKLGTPAGKPVAASDWNDNPGKAFWYFDREMADAVNDYASVQLTKKPQMIDFLIEGQPAPLVKNGFADYHPKLVEDGVTFKIDAVFMDKSPTTNLFSGESLAHAAGPILFRVGSGGLRQTSSNTFQIAIDRGSVARQGPPWEPWVLAYHFGDATFRAADRPAHISLNTRNIDGRPQTILFSKIPFQKIGGKPVKLFAKSDSGLPVQFFVVSGPVELGGVDLDTLMFKPLPPRAKFPVRVIVGAYQWGRSGEVKIQSAQPVFEEFFIEK